MTCSATRWGGSWPRTPPGSHSWCRMDAPRIGTASPHRLPKRANRPSTTRLAHQLSAVLRLRQPRWLSEGIACFLETVAIIDDGPAATVGAPNETPPPPLHAVGLRCPARQVFAWKRRDRDYGAGSTPTSLGPRPLAVQHPPGPVSPLPGQLPGASTKGGLAAELSPSWTWTPSTALLSHTPATGNTAPSGSHPAWPTRRSRRAAPRRRAARHPSAAGDRRRTLLQRPSRALASPGRRSRGPSGGPQQPQRSAGQASLARAPGERITLLRRATAAHPGSGVAWMTLAGLLQETDAPHRRWRPPTKALEA